MANRPHLTTDRLSSGPNSNTKLDPETIRIRDVLIENYLDAPIVEINTVVKQVLNTETDPIKRLGALAARVYLIRHRIMNLKTDADEPHKLLPVSEREKVPEEEFAESEVADAPSEASSSEWVRVRMLEQAEMNGMRFFEGIIVDVRKDDAEKLVETNRGELVETPSDGTASVPSSTIVQSRPPADKGAEEQSESELQIDEDTVPVNDEAPEEDTQEEDTQEEQEEGTQDEANAQLDVTPDMLPQVNIDALDALDDNMAALDTSDFDESELEALFSENSDKDKN